MSKNLTGKKFRHKGNKKLYRVLESSEDYSIKQASDNEWESVIFYQNIITLQPFITGRKRFLDVFELVEEDTHSTDQLRRENKIMREALELWTDFENKSIARYGKYEGEEINKCIETARKALKEIGEL